jgi:glycosyltransferase involved in cell wall biosynthesis
MSIELSVVMPCLNEAETLATCIKKAQDFLNQNKISGEVIIADNGSTDGSQDIAHSLNARVISVQEKGYGSALRGGIDAAKGKYVMMGDADDSYDFSNMMPYLVKLREGYDLVMGNRFKGGIEKGAMPFLHKYLGNPVLSFLGRLFFKSNIGDFHCGLRGFSKEAYNKMKLKTTGMEFASEMIVSASLKSMKIAEVPTTLSKDGRSRPPHLNTWRDGWRHLRFLVLFSPGWLFLYPSILFCLVGFITSALLITGPFQIGS